MATPPGDVKPKLSRLTRDGSGGVDPLSTSASDLDLAAQGLNSIEFQLDVQQGFQQSTIHSVVQTALLKTLFNSLLIFN